MTITKTPATAEAVLEAVGSLMDAIAVAKGHGLHVIAGGISGLTPNTLRQVASDSGARVRARPEELTCDVGTVTLYASVKP